MTTAISLVVLLSVTAATFDLRTLLKDALAGSPHEPRAARTDSDGDGLTDGFVTGTFFLAAGEYTLAVGGANYFLQGTDSLAPNYDNTNYTFTATVSNVPEPSAAGLLVAGVAALGMLRQRYSSPRRAPRA